MFCWCWSNLHYTLPIVPQELDCGHCLAGDTKTVLMKCDNFGGEGSFKLLPVDGTREENKEVGFADI